MSSPERDVDLPTVRHRRRRKRLTLLRAYELARAMTGGVRDPAFRALVERIDSGPTHLLPHAHLLADGEAAFHAVGAAIAAAQDEILVETYILRDDRIGEAMFRALQLAVARGVRVHVLADAVGSWGTGRIYWRKLEAAGITVRLFHRWWINPLNLLRRDHRKIVVVDRRVAFTGGMNIGAEYGSSIRKHGYAWRDTFIRVEGPVALELAAVFAEGWDRAGGPVLPGLEYVSWSDGIVAPPRGFAALRRQALTARMKRRLALRRDRRKGRRVRRGEESAPDVDARAIHVLDSRPGRGQPETIAVLASLVAGARERLWITTPYFAPPRDAIEILAAAVARGVDVRLMLPGKTDMAVIKHAAHGSYRRLLRAGVHVYEYQAAVLHAKTMVVDGAVGVVGSANLDFRSFLFNAECNLLLFDEATGQALEESFLRDQGASNEINMDFWRTRTRPHRLLDAIARGLRWFL